MTFVCIMPNGDVALRPDHTLPSDDLEQDEHPLDACLRIPLEQAGFRYQHFHPFGLDGGHLFGWVEGDRYHTPPVEPAIGIPNDASEAALAAHAIKDHAAQPDEVYYRENVRTLERAYLLSSTPQGQSGFGGDAEAWRARRIDIANAIDHDGTFLDMGCANGYLAECVVAWCKERGIAIEPFGVDLAPELVSLAHRRLPQWADRFWVGNAVDWVHPEAKRFDFVHILLDAVPTSRRRDLIQHHLDFTVAPGGRLLVSEYGVQAGTTTAQIVEQLGFRADGWSPSVDPVRPTAGTAWITPPG